MSAPARPVSTPSRPSQHRRPPGPVFPVIETKLSAPPSRTGLIRRDRLVARLRASRDVRVVSVLAPPGYGKTTLLSQWAQEEDRPVVWLTVDERDDDPSVFLTYLAVGLDRIHPLDPRVFATLAAPTSPVPTAVVARLSAALKELDQPALFVLDDLHVLTEPVCLDVLDGLVGGLPEGSQVALGGRSDVAPRSARWRTEGRLLEIGAADLALRHDEAASLLRTTVGEVPEAQVAELVRRTEGWPAGLYLAALSIRSGSDPETLESFTGADRYLADYFRSEIFERLSPKDLRFLLRTSVLDRLCGSLCDAVTGTRRSTGTLERLEGSNLFLVPLDRRRGWYRYHHLFREALVSELERREPGRAPELRRHAAGWHERSGMPEIAVEYCLAAGDAERAARVATPIAQPMIRLGRMATVLRWFEWFEARDAMGAYAPFAVLAAWIRAFMGDAAGSDRWAEAAERAPSDRPLPDGSRSIESWLAVLRAVRCVDGVSRMRADAERAVSTLPRASFWYPTALVLSGSVRMLSGEPDGAIRLVEAVEFAEAVAAYPALCFALAELASSAASRGDWAAAGTALDRALGLIDEVHLEGYPTSGLAFALGARAAIRRGDQEGARRHLVRAQRLRPVLTTAMPWAAVHMRLELMRAHVALADPAGARTLLREIDDILQRRPDLGTLNAQVQETRHLVKAMPSGDAGVSSLTAAELRLLPFLHTHLAFREIAQRLFISPNTVKTQAISLYRKLGVSSRSDAVARAEELGLIER